MEEKLKPQQVTTGEKNHLKTNSSFFPDFLFSQFERTKV
jgi:hypothetical protein